MKENQERLHTLESQVQYKGEIVMNQPNLGVSRRHFVKSGSLATAAVTAFHVLPSKNARAQQPIKVAVVGCGGRGRGAMMDSIRADNAVEIVALADIFEDKLELAKQELEKAGKSTRVKTFKGFKAYQELMKEDFDYVILTTPPCYRPETLEAAIEAGKHVFMEKPAAVDAPGIRRIIAAGDKAKEKGLSIAAGTQRRHQKPYIEVVKRIHDGEIGELVNGQTFWCGGPIGFPDRKDEWSDVEWQMRGWYHWLWLSGDHILEQHVHNIDVTNWIMQDHPIRAYGSGGRSWQERGDIWDHHAVHFTYPNGVSIMSMCSQYPRGDSRVEERSQGTKGSSFTAQGGPFILWDEKNKIKYQWEGDYTNPYIQEHIDLIDSIRNEKGLNEAREIAISTMSAMMGRMAEYSGKELTWEEAYNSEEKYPIYYELKDLEKTYPPIPGGQKYSEDAGWKPG